MQGAPDAETRTPRRGYLPRHKKGLQTNVSHSYAGLHATIQSQSRLNQDTTKPRPRLIQGTTRQHSLCTQDTCKRHARSPEAKPRHKTAAGLGHLGDAKAQENLLRNGNHSYAGLILSKSQSQLTHDATKPRPRLIQGTTKLNPRCTQDTSRKHARST